MSDDQCPATIYDQGTQMSCALLSGHAGVHVDGRYGWGSSDTTVHLLPNMCRATTNTGLESVTCQKLGGHAGAHVGGGLTWSNVQPLQERGPEQVPEPCGSQWRKFPSGHLVCTREKGHDESHSDGQSAWPQAQKNYQSTNLAGASYEDLIRDLFERIENLEQTSAGGAAVDDMFAPMNRAVVGLQKSAADHQRRLLGLERAQVYGPEPHNFSALQASMTNHTNRALADLGSGLISRLEEVAERITLSLRTDLAAALDRLDPPKPPSCGDPDQAGLYTCELADGHDGRHVNGISTWPNWCGAEHPSLEVACVLVKGHTTGLHQAAPDTRYGRARWADDGAQTERASGPPAAVRCQTQFREGPCLGYAGHDGDCSAVPGEEQLEDPTEDDYPEQNFHS